MDSALLHAFVAVAETGSFSRAGETLHLTQPAVSKRIAGLEQELGQRLFDRVGHAVHLTPAGQTLLPRARELLLAIDDTARALRNLDGDVAGTLRIATSHHIGLRRLPPVLREYTRRHPQVKLEFDFVDSEQAYHEVEQGSRELAIITLPDQEEGNVAAHRIWNERLIACVHREHVLASQGQLPVAALGAHRAVLLGGHTFTQQRINDVFRDHQVSLHDATSSTYLEAIAMLVNAGQGWALLPDIMIGGDLVALDTTPAIAIHRVLGVVHHRARTLSNAARAMVALLCEQAALPDPAETQRNEMART